MVTFGCFVGGYDGHFALVNDLAFIDNLFIYPQFRKKGYSYTILKHVCEFLRYKKYENVSLACQTSNEIALHTYEKFGFCTVQSNWLVKIFKHVLKSVKVYAA